MPKSHCWFFAVLSDIFVQIFLREVKWYGNSPCLAFSSLLSTHFVANSGSSDTSRLSSFSNSRRRRSAFNEISERVLVNRSPRASPAFKYECFVHLFNLFSEKQEIVGSILALSHKFFMLPKVEASPKCPPFGFFRHYATFFSKIFEFPLAFFWSFRFVETFNEPLLEFFGIVRLF